MAINHKVITLHGSRLVLVTTLLKVAQLRVTTMTTLKTLLAPQSEALARILVNKVKIPISRKARTPLESRLVLVTTLLKAAQLLARTPNSKTRIPPPLRFEVLDNKTVVNTRIRILVKFNLRIPREPRL